MIFGVVFAVLVWANMILLRPARKRDAKLVPIETIYILVYCAILGRQLRASPSRTRPGGPDVADFQNRYALPGWATSTSGRLRA
jgi:hypothetical protein